jgi:hypothetical protein
MFMYSNSECCLRCSLKFGLNDRANEFGLRLKSKEIF